MIHCGGSYVTPEARGVLTTDQIADLAVFALEHQTGAAPVLVAALEAQLESMMAPQRNDEVGSAE